MKYIEEFWQEPRFEDLAAAAAGKPLPARYHSSKPEPVTVTGLLVGYHAGLNPWIIAVGANESLRYSTTIQVYRPPVPPDGYELIDTSKTEPQEGDICYYDSKWCIEFALGDTIGFLANTLYARKITPTPYEGYELIDTKTATPRRDDLFWNRETKAWHVRIPDAIVSFIPGVFYCRKKQPVRVEYSFEEANELTGKKLFINNGKCKVSVLINKITQRNDGEVIVNDYYQSYLIKHAVIQLDAKSKQTVPFGKETKR